MSSEAAPAADWSGPFLQLRGVKKRFGDLQVLSGVDLEIDRGEVVPFD